MVLLRNTLKLFLIKEDLLLMYKKQTILWCNYNTELPPSPSLSVSAR